MYASDPLTSVHRALWLLLGLSILSASAITVGNYLDPLTIDAAHRYRPPDLTYWLGTDGLGRDLLARTVFAVGLSFKVVLYAVLVAGILSLLLGGIAGYYAHGWIDHLVAWVTALLTSIPFFIWVIALFAVVPADLETIYLAIGMLAWAGPARTVREVVVQLRRAPFVLAGRAFGFPAYRVMLQSFLVLAVPPVFFSLVYAIPELVAVEVGLSFFGLGAQPPTPTLGRMVYEGLSEWSIAWWVALLPSAIFAMILTGIYGYAVRSFPVDFEK